MTRAEWRRDRMEQERMEDEAVTEREEAEAIICAVILAAAFREMLKALGTRADTVIPYPLGSDGAW